MTVAAISTPNAAGGIGIVRVSGERAIQITDKIFTSFYGKTLDSMKGYTAAYGRVSDGDGDIDEAVVIVYRAPKSYTGEDVTEICCHGGLYIMQRVLRAVLAAGAAPAGPGEFTRRAYMNGKLDLSSAESVMNIISANSQTALNAARSTLEGSVAKRADEICSGLLTVNASLAVWADYPDDDVPAVQRDNLIKTLEDARDKLAALIKNYDSGRVVTQGADTVICGKPNVGKSTLMNALTGFDRSIVTPVAGTTRDIIEETVRLGDVVLRLRDTAGIHETPDEIESIGVKMAKTALERAQLIFAVFDVSRPLNGEDRALLEQIRGKNAIAVLNKNDLEKCFLPDEITRYGIETVEICANDPACTDILRETVNRILGVDGLDFTAGMLTGERQLACVKRALSAVETAINNLVGGLTLDVINIDIDTALSALYELTGKNVSEETVNEVFRKFCVGK